MLFVHTFSAMKNPGEHFCKIIKKNNSPYLGWSSRSFHFLSKTWFLINNNSFYKIVNRVFHFRTGHPIIRNSMLKSKDKYIKIFWVPFVEENLIWIFSILRVSLVFVQNWGILLTRMNFRGTTWKWILAIFIHKK